MSDEQPKKSLSEPPPPTDEIDQDWGTPARSAPTHAAPAVDEEEDDLDEEEDDEDDDDEDEDEEEDDEDEPPRSRAVHPSGRPLAVAQHADGSLPDWVPWAVLAALVSAGIAGALGAFSGF